MAVPPTFDRRNIYFMCYQVYTWNAIKVDKPLRLIKTMVETLSFLMRDAFALFAVVNFDR